MNSRVSKLSRTYLYALLSLISILLAVTSGIVLSADQIPHVKTFDLPSTHGTVCLSFDKYGREYGMECRADQDTAALITIQVGGAVYKDVVRIRYKTCVGEREKGLIGYFTGEKESYEYECNEEYTDRVFDPLVRSIHFRLTDFDEELELSSSVDVQRRPMICDSGKCVALGEWESIASHSIPVNQDDVRGSDFVVEENDEVRVIISSQTAKTADIAILEEQQRLADERVKEQQRLADERAREEKARIEEEEERRKSELPAERQAFLAQTTIELKRSLFDRVFATCYKNDSHNDMLSEIHCDREAETAIRNWGHVDISLMPEPYGSDLVEELERRMDIWDRSHNP
jgi:hypothetical protein